MAADASATGIVNVPTYRCTAAAQGLAGGPPQATPSVPLARYETISPRWAVEWTRNQALRLADLMDPPPGAAWVPAALLTPVTDLMGDVPTGLRQWAADAELQRAARVALVSTGRLRLVGQDHSGRYVLSVVRIDVPMTSPDPTPSYTPPMDTRPRPPSRRGGHRRWRKLSTLHPHTPVPAP